MTLSDTTPCGREAARPAATGTATATAPEVPAALAEEWPFLLTLLPADLEASARTYRAFQRARGVTCAADLLRLAFAYSYAGLSLRDTATWARQAGVATLSDVAVLNRLRGAAPWLGQLLLRTLAARGVVAPRGAGGLRLRLVDATTVSRPGAKGTDYRLHLGYQLETQQIDRLEVTGAAGGESLVRSGSAPGDVLVADRGYAHRRGFAAVVAAGGHLLVRLCWHSVPLQHPDGTPFDLLAALRDLPAGAVGAWEVATRPEAATKKAPAVPAVPGRLIAVRRSPAAAEAARRRVRQEARRKGRTPDARSLETAGFLFIFTTVPAAALSAAQVLEVYRFRWQIELTFKQLKSLLFLDELAAKDDALCQTFLYTKLLAMLLIEDLSRRWIDFSPWGYGPPQPVLPAVAVAGLPGRRRDVAPDDRCGAHARAVGARPPGPCRADAHLSEPSPKTAGPGRARA